jgi:hypothetical protein
MAKAKEIEPDPVLQEIINDVMDRKRMSAGIEACRERESDFSSKLEMQLAGIAMVPEARDLVTERLNEYWSGRRLSSLLTVGTSNREVIAGGGLHAATYCAARARMGYPRPIVLERGNAEQVGGAFAVSMRPVFRLNSRSRPGKVGLPDQGKALNDIPGGLVQPSMISSEGYPDNADMAWLIRLVLAQYADVYPGTAVTEIEASGGQNSALVRADNGTFQAARAIDARGIGTERELKPSESMLTFGQFMARMGGMFPLRGIKQVAVIGGGNSGLCAAESLLGIAPGHTSAIGLDYVERVDLYAVTVDGRSCEEFRAGARGRYMQLAQFLTGNASQPEPGGRLRLMGVRGFPTALPGDDGVLVNDRSYDMAIVCTGSALEPLTTRYAWGDVRADPLNTASTVLAKQARPLPLFKIGPAADIAFSAAETEAGIAGNPASKVAMFRLVQRTAALGAMLPGLT